MSTVRVVRVVAVVLIALSTIGACAAPAAPGRVSFMVFGDPAELKAYQTLVSAFEQKNPGIQIELIHIPSQGDYRTRLAADFAASAPANVVLINYRSYAAFAAKGVLEPIGPYLANSSAIKEADFYPEAIQPFTYRGALMCLPQNVSSLVVYYNKNLFDAAGWPYPKADWTWDDFVKTAQALTKDTTGDGQPDQYGLGMEASLIRVAPFIWQNGGDLVSTPIGSGLIVDTPAAKAAIQWFVDLQVKHHVAPDAAAEKSEDSETRFMNGRTAMFLDSRRVTPTFREITAFDWDVAPLPNNGQGPATILHSDAECMTTATPDKAAAWKFMEYANSVEGQTILAATGRIVPSLKVVAQSAAFLDPNARPKNSRAWLDVIPAIRSVPILKNWADVEDIFGAELERAFYQGASVDDVVQAMIERTRIYLNNAE
jgi:multiple sugar transport system substrate-binding protein